MSQSRRASACEALASTVIGFGVSWIVTLVVIPWFFDVRVSVAQGLGVTLIYTAISIVRGYLVRRAFNRLHWGRA